MSEIKKYCKVYEAVKILGIKRHTIVNMLKDGRLKGKKFTENGNWFVERESMVQWEK